MTRLIFSFLAMFFAEVASANPVRVRAGEHGSFTRVVLEFDIRPTWKAQRTGTGLRLSFNQASPLNFDLSKTFRLIDRTRVANIRLARDNTLDVDIACNCDFRFNEAGDSALIIDVVSLDAPTPGTFSTVIPISPLIAQDGVADAPSADTVVAGRKPPLVLPRIGMGATLDAGIGASSRGESLLVQNLPSENRSVAVELMGRALSRAAAQGLVSADLDVGPNTRVASGPTLGLEEDHSNISVTTSFDRAMRPDMIDVSPTHRGTVCLPEGQIDVANWGDAKDSGLLGRLRSAAVSEDGSVEASGAAKLARYYIHMGFGTEAKAAAKYVPSSRDRDILTALAEIMDHGRTEASMLQGQVSCDGAISLWAALAAPLKTSEIPSNTNAILSTFSALPPHLRDHLGPILSERFHAVELHEQARTVINAMTRGGSKTEESELASARLELEGTQGDTARETLAELSNGTDLTAAGALLELLKDAEQRGMAPNPIWVEDAPTLVGALEGTKIAEDLNIAGLRGLVALGRFQEFRAAVVDDSPGLSPDVRRNLALFALRSALETGSDRDFVLSEVGLSKLVEPGLHDREQRLAIATRLLEIGLATRALSYVSASPETLKELEVKVRGLIADNRNVMAIEIVRNSPLSGAERLLASALVAGGEDANAIRAFEAVGEMEEASGAALRTGNWSWLSENGTEPISTATRALASPEPVAEPISSETPNGALILAARERRAQVRSFLELTKPDRSTTAFTN